jgi:hypothetical protein
MSVSIQVNAQASRHYTEFVDFRNLRRFDDWCRTLGVTRHQLVSAVAVVGENVEAVRSYLRGRRS